MEVNVTIRGEEKFRSFIEENATIDFEAAKQDLEAQFLAELDRSTLADIALGAAVPG